MKRGNIILIGVKGVGKTTYGKKLAERVHYHFVDTDEAVERLHSERKKETLRCPEIYHLHGEKYFRELEWDVIHSLEGLDHTVIALGGGAILTEATRKLLPKLGTIVCLHLEKIDVISRWKGSTGLFSDEKQFQELFEKRLALAREIPCTWLRADSDQTLLILEEMIIGK